MGGPSCKLKIIMNGRTIQDELYSLCYQIQEEDADEIPYDEGIKMVKLLNKAENLVFQAKRIFLETQGFEGPWPYSLEGDKYEED